MNQEDRLAELKERIREKGRLMVAYSGGVDSSLLAALARDALGDNALAVILDSETLPRGELQQAAALAGQMGLNFRIAKFNILQQEPFQDNTPRRCYICKKSSIALLKSIAAEEGIGSIADGLNRDDCQQWRPGTAACHEEGIWHPLLEAGMGKEDIRAAAREPGPAGLEQAILGLPCHQDRLWPAHNGGDTQNGGGGRGSPEEPRIRAAESEG